MTIRELLGFHVRLRDIRHIDLDAYGYWQQPGHEWQALNGPYYPRGTQEKITQTIDAIEARIASGDWPDPRTRLVIAKKGSDEFLGTVSRYWISRETN